MRKIIAIAATALGFVVGLVPAAAQRTLTPVTDAMLRNPDPADWLMWRRTLNSWGYSPLDQIDRSNVARL
jgi:glucose dehydrogenase